MKRFFASVVAVSLLLTLNTYTAIADYAYPSDLCGVENVFLSYTLSEYAPSGRRTAEQYRPLVGYNNTDGKPVDSYFDTFLFLPCVTAAPSGGFTYYSTENPNNFSDWQAFVDDCFRDGYNIPALNKAVAEFKREMGDGYENYKAKVFLSCIYPVQTQRNFGDVDGDGKSEDFSVYADRIKALNWMIDEQLSRFYSGNYENLELIGFYWFEETVYNETYGKQIIKDFNSIVHSKDLKTIWIPYYTASSKEMWRTLGFDVACLQPNYMFYNVGAARVNSACTYANKNGMCLEIESCADVLTKAEYYNRYITYLEGCIKNGADKGIKMYYNEGGDGVYYTAYKAGDSRARGIYDLTYKFAKGILTTDELSYIQRDDVFSLDDYEIVTKGKPYTATAPYTDSAFGYADIDGAELTDGVLGKSDLGSEWHAFHVSNKEPDGSYTVTIDLGETVKDINFFASEFEWYTTAGIDLPSAVYYEVSTDGINFTRVGQAEITDNDWNYDYSVALLQTSDYYRARYIRAKIMPGKLNFVFCSEVAAGRTSRPYRQCQNIALGKPYTASPPYTNTTMPYGNNDGKELTDGIYGKYGYGTEWHAFNKTIVEEGQPYTVTIDLGETYSGIVSLNAEFEKIAEASIDLPDSVAFYASTDGKEYTLLGEAEPLSLGNDMYDAGLQPEWPAEARYIRAVIGRGSMHFVFCSEISVRRDPQSTSDVIDERLDGLAVYDGIREKTTLAAFNAEYRGVYRSESLSGEGYIATGTVITCGLNSFTAIVKGDVNGDGTVSSPDYNAVKRHILGTAEITDEYRLTAANIDGGALNAFDYLLIKRHVIGVYNIYGGLSE